MPITNQENREHWKNLIQMQKESGLTVVQFCKEHQLRFHQFHYYKKILSTSKRRPKNKLTPVKVIHPEDDQGRVVVYLNKVSITFEGDYELQKIANLCHLLDQR